MNEEEIIYNKILSILTAILCIFISIIITIFIGISKVDAASITTSDYHVMGINTSWGID
jgi:hypothetical protein